MPVYNVPNLASNNRGSTTQNYYSSLNRPNPVGNQLGNQTGTAQPGPSFFDGGGWQQGQDANPYLQQYLNGRNPYGRSGFNIENTLAGSQTGSNQFGDPRLAQYGYSFGPGAGSESGSENAWRGNGTMGLDQRGLINRNGVAYAQAGEIMDRIIDPTKVFYDDEFGLLTDPSNIHNPDSNMTRMMPAIVSAALGVPTLMHAGVIGAGAAAGSAPEVAGGTSTLGTTGIPGGVASGVAPAVPGAGGTITGVGGLPAASVGGGVAVPAAGSVTGTLAGGAGAATAAASGGSSIAQTLAQYGITGRDVAGVLGGVMSLANSGRTQRGLNAAADRADPFGQYRPQAGQDLMNFMNDPSYIYQRPGYIARRDQGEQGINRAAAGKGYFRSPNMLFDLSKFNSDLAAQEFDAEYRRLAAMAGVDVNPATAAGLQAQGVNSSTNMRTAGAMQIGASIFDWLFR